MILYVHLMYMYFARLKQNIILYETHTNSPKVVNGCLYHFVSLHYRVYTKHHRQGKRAISDEVRLHTHTSMQSESHHSWPQLCHHWT